MSHKATEDVTEKNTSLFGWNFRTLTGPQILFSIFLGQMHFCQTTRTITKFGTLTIDFFISQCTLHHYY